ncbi:hypothetical protein FOMG_15919 [Fusarium oxysporum f. sp. melonis 26406]|uniref:Uncharacterized protein n=1 Tax=Fusarium oxysporum f. sp. melonis 26406 TaxID=1089452 RepID=X0A353_FUSOX|nr:hypothetical protein FOMG_15919 [Fusarium oxysporum f. sp. melonis 26406]
MSPEEPPEEMTSFEDRDLRPGELLRWVYGTLPGVLLEDSATDRSAMERSDEEDFKKEVYKGFVGFEAKFSSSSGMHNFERYDPIASSEAQARMEDVKDTLRFFNTQLVDSPRADTLGNASVAPSAQHPSDDSFFQIEKSIEYSNRVGDLNVGWYDMVKTLPYYLWETLAGRMSDLNRSIEKEHVNEDIDIAVITKRNTGAEPLDKQQNLRHDELLYRHLASHICTAERHQVLLQLPSPDSNTWHIRMPRCSHNMETESCYNAKYWWQETQIISVTIDNTLVSAKKGSKVPDDDPLNICAENAAHLERRKKQLHLLCNRSRISLHKNQSNTFSDIKKAQSWSNVKPLDEILINFKRVDAQDPSETVARFRLALQVCVSLFYLFPGPWVQQEWSSSLFQAPWGISHRGLSADLTQTSFLCEILKDWDGQNRIFEEFLEAQKNPSPNPPGFFLSLAQLLVDICEGKAGDSSVATKDSEPFQDLSTKIDELMSDDLLQFYGCAIESCRTYDFLYREASVGDTQSREMVRLVGEKHIIKYLQSTLELWEPQARQYTTQIAVAAQQDTNEPPLLQRLSERPYHGSVFTLFGDEQWEKRNKRPIEKTVQEFITNLTEFYTNYVNPSPECIDPAQDITIAVLDTGLHRHESDVAFRYSKKIDEERCRDFVADETGQTKGTFDDTHGHGTHVVKLLLRFAPRARIIVLKVSENSSLEKTRLLQIKNALEYAGTVADIITMSFGLGDAAMPTLRPVIKKLKTAQKLIFAAASNSGGNGKRSYPANEAGVFAIHATKGDGSTPENLNPPRLHGPDNFATLGWKIPSSWNGDKVFISGTSFATPVAAAMAANLMEIICRTPTESNGRGSRRVGGYGDMRRLLLKMQHEVGNYQYLRPWAQGMFDGNKDFSEMRDELQSLLIEGESPR